MSHELRRNLPTILVTALSTAVLTAVALELVRPTPVRPDAPVVPAPPGAGPSDGGERASTSPSPGDARTLSPSTAGAPAAADPWTELERRLRLLEATADRRPVDDGRGPADFDGPEAEALRERVLGWVAEERGARRAAERIADREQLEKELWFGARYEALMLAEEHGLPDWSRDQLGEALFEIELRHHDYEVGIDPLTDDPLEVEAGWVELEEWADGVLVATLGGELFEELFGEEEWEDGPEEPEDTD